MYIFNTNSANATSKIVNLLMSKGVNPLDILIIPLRSILVAKNKNKIFLSKIEKVKFEEDIFYTVYDKDNIYGRHKLVAYPLYKAICDKFGNFDDGIVKIRNLMMRGFFVKNPDILMEYTARRLSYCFSFNNDRGFQNVTNFSGKIAGLKSHSSYHTHLLDEFPGVNLKLALTAIELKYNKFISLRIASQYLINKIGEKSFQLYYTMGNGDSFSSISSFPSNNNLPYLIKAIVKVYEYNKTHSARSKAASYLSSLYAHQVRRFKLDTCIKFLFGKPSIFRILDGGREDYINSIMIHSSRTNKAVQEKSTEKEVNFKNGYKAKPIFCGIKRILKMRNEIIQSLNLIFREKKREVKARRPKAENIIDTTFNFVESVSGNIRFLSVSNYRLKENLADFGFMKDMKTLRTVHMANEAIVLFPAGMRKFVYFPGKKLLFAHVKRKFTIVKNSSVEVTITSASIRGCL